MTRTNRWLVQRAWLGGDELAHGVLIEIEDGLFSAVEPGSADTKCSRLAGVALPGLVNAHSHAFHRLLRGRTHRQGGDFWVWRDRMYEVAGQLTPDDYEAVAVAVFTEMAMAGVTTVGEFHYLHHQTGGGAYDDPNEMGHALIRAARRAGIRISLLDAAYLSAGFGDDPLHPAQQRFSDGTAENWLERVSALESVYTGSRDVRIGLAPHSVRAVPEPDLAYVGRNRPRDTPVHIHVSEQPAENEACVEATGTTPVGLLDRVDLLGAHTTAVHATHVSMQDIVTLGKTRTTVCYCPTTERELADGLGPSADLHRAGSPSIVGSDSHAVIDLFEEMRGVEMHERLRSGRRGVFSPTELARAATVDGARALGFEGGRIEVGEPANFTVVSLETPRTLGAGDDLASLVFSATASDVTDVFVSGSQVVADGHHPEWESVRGALLDGF